MIIAKNPENYEGRLTVRRCPMSRYQRQRMRNGHWTDPEMVALCRWMWKGGRGEGCCATAKHAGE